MNNNSRNKYKQALTINVRENKGNGEYEEQKIQRKVPFVGMMGWAVNSIAEAVEGSIPFLPNRNIIHKHSN